MPNLFYEGTSLVIDLHGMVVSEAEVLLEQQFDYLPPSIKEVRVIHGFHGGNALLDLVRRKFKHRRIESRRIGLNKGVTLFILK